MRKLGLFMRIFRALWSTRKGDGSNAHILRQTSEVMGAAGFVQGTGPAVSDAVVNALYAPAWDDIWQDAFTLTPAHIDLIQRANLTWDGGEVGAPKLSVSAPYADGTTPQHLTRLLGEEADEDTKRDFLISMVQAFSTYCDTVEIAAGDYDVDGQTVTLTDDTIALTRHLQWDWADEDDMADALEKGEVAGPRCDCKRPYGDMSFYALDVHRLLCWETLERTEQGYIKPTDAQIAAADALHAQILPALRAVLRHGTIPHAGA